MLPQLVLFTLGVCGQLLAVRGYLPSSPGRRHGTFVGSGVVSSLASANKWSMDIESFDDDDVSLDVIRSNLEEILHPTTTTSHHGMPWTTSIDTKVHKHEHGGLLYMPFWEWQMSFMKEHLTNLRLRSCSNGETDFSYKENADKKARIVNACFSSKEYRKIRLTYYDAGEATQVFNAVWYPHPSSDLPVLGIDVLAFQRKKFLAIVDFQPLHDGQHDAIESELQPIKDKYKSLHGLMSSKFYDETQFFSKQMLFSRFEDESIVDKDLFPAFQEYVKSHVDLVKKSSSSETNNSPARVLELQRAYDTYSAERDPAAGLFAAMFGPEWADDYIHDFLFSMSERPSEDANKKAAPRPQQKQAPVQKQPAVQQQQQPAFRTR